MNLVQLSTSRELPRARSSAPVSICTDEIQGALALVLGSAVFARAPRMSQLLRFLVMRIAGSTISDVSPSAIAADVFGRDADSFDPSIDPIVRVQLGRLREKLDRYYASADCRAALRFDIPIGTCMPSVTWRVPKNRSNPDLPALQFVGMNAIGDIDSRSFCHGFNEQLLYEVYRACGERITVHTTTTQPLRRRLEGALRVEASHLRVSTRLIDNNSGRLLWAHQLDCRFKPSIHKQEQMAREICTALLPQL